MLRLFAVTPQTLLSAPTVPPRSDGMSRAAPSDRNNLAPWPMTAITLQFQFQCCNTTDRYKGPMRKISSTCMPADNNMRTTNT